jgi:hypothetical protein
LLNGEEVEALPPAPKQPAVTPAPKDGRLPPHEAAA